MPTERHPACPSAPAPCLSLEGLCLSRRADGFARDPWCCRRRTAPSPLASSIHITDSRREWHARAKGRHVAAAIDVGPLFRSAPFSAFLCLPPCDQTLPRSCLVQPTIGSNILGAEDEPVEDVTRGLPFDGLFLGAVR